MKVFSGFNGLPADARGAVVALGNFDGVHRGHASLLAAARAEATRLGCRLAVLTFSPHPRSVFDPEAKPFRLTSDAEKARLLENQGVDLLYTMTFDESLAAMSAADFQDRVLRDGLDAKAIVAGANFRFGRGREGTLQSLAARDPALTILTPPIASDGAGNPVSSTAVRGALAAADPRLAADLLGRFWTIDYTVETGDRRGRELGFPTANGRLGELIRPAYGIYAVEAWLADGKRLAGAANIGVRPMWRSLEPLVETFLFDFDGDLYGQTLRIALVDYLRGEEKFADIEALKDQMAKDCQLARQIIEKLRS